MSKVLIQNIKLPGTSLVVQQLRIRLAMQRQSSIPGQGTKIPQASEQLSQHATTRVHVPQQKIPQDTTKITQWRPCVPHLRPNNQPWLCWINKELLKKKIKLPYFKLIHKLIPQQTINTFLIFNNLYFSGSLAKSEICIEHIYEQLI